MLSKVITIAQQKGGTGKTTLSVHLALAFIKYHNLKVAIIDTDPQGSLGKWFMIRTEVRKLHKKLGQKEFFNKLIKLDPLAKNFVLPSDIQRSMRVYEVKKFTNKSLFDLIQKTKSNFNNQVFKKLFINTPRELLHSKIEERVEAMFKDGAIKEVEKFLKLKIYRELSANKIIGVKEIAGYLKGKTTITETKKLITLKTRQYAKRQFTWARGHMKSWEMIYSTNVNDLFKKAVNKIS